MRVIAKILKIIGLFFLAIAILVGAFWGYEHKEKLQREKEELNFATGAVEWKWHDEYYRIQIHTFGEGSSLLRKVNLQKRYVIYVHKNQDRTLNALVQFFVDCKPNSEITTSQKYSDGTPMKLRCTEAGNALTYSASWSERRTDFVWTENLDGFKIRVDFRNWDFTKLDQEITLSNAK